MAEKKRQLFREKHTDTLPFFQSLLNPRPNIFGIAKSIENKKFDASNQLPILQNNSTVVPHQEQIVEEQAEKQVEEEVKEEVGEQEKQQEEEENVNLELTPSMIEFLQRSEERRRLKKENRARQEQEDQRTQQENERTRIKRQKIEREQTVLALYDQDVELVQKLEQEMNDYYAWSLRRYRPVLWPNLPILC
eukprot:Lithocolla_globosa_v1_NODE_2909_length_1827_cov_39.576749.p2 type:complete len:192 gc:universal NODE_2909_length_1827_cov_39.576749:662-87(-)